MGGRDEEQRGVAFARKRRIASAEFLEILNLTQPLFSFSLL
jgi:hypothetical protein